MPLSVKGIDHFVIRVADLDAGEQLFERLGFTLTPRGFHAGRGSANHTAPLSSGNYFELIYLPPGADSSSFASRPEGPVALALEPTDSRTIHAELTALGYESEPPRDLARPGYRPTISPILSRIPSKPTRARSASIIWPIFRPGR